MGIRISLTSISASDIAEVCKSTKGRFSDYASGRGARGSMVAYLDSSVVLRYVLKGDSAIRHALACETILSSELLEIECRRVLQRCRLIGELSDITYVTAVKRLDALLAGISLLALSSPVKKRAMDAFPVVIKTFDALHLATAILYSEKQSSETMLVFSYDEAMNRCASVLGFAVPLA